MVFLSKEFIRNNVADSALIFQRGETIYRHGSYFLSGEERGEGASVYQVDGSYGDYTTRVALRGEGVVTSCTCPYPGEGCKHVVAALLNARDILMNSVSPGSLSSRWPP